jgi:hypothetical protein
MYIKQKDSDVYIVNIEGFENNLSQHPAVVNYPDLFEIVEGEVPENFNRLIYEENNE